MESHSNETNTSLVAIGGNHLYRDPQLDVTSDLVHNPNLSDDVTAARLQRLQDARRNTLRPKILPLSCCSSWITLQFAAKFLIKIDRRGRGGGVLRK